MGYFTLLPIAEFEYDELGATIINLLDFSRIHYSREEKEFLLSVLNCEVESIEKFDSMEQSLMLELLDKGLAYLYNNRVFNDVHRENRDAEIRGLVEEVPHFSKIYLEITEECNMDCIFCKNNVSIEKSCNSCIKWRKSKEGDIQRFDYEKLIQRISGLWVDEIVISGGNPLLSKETLIDYIIQIRKCMPDITISIYTNGEGIDGQLMDFFEDYDISIKFVLFKYEEITKCDGVYKNTYMSIKKCINNNVDCSIILLGDEKLILKKKEIEIELGCPICYIVPNKNEICEKNKFSERKKRVTKNFWKNQKYNSCLNNKLAISLDGLVRPCPMIDDVLLDLKVENLDKLFQNMLIDKYWRFTKKDVKICSDCPYKYSCEDCTALEIEINKGNLEHIQLCDRHE